MTHHHDNDPSSPVASVYDAMGDRPSRAKTAAYKLTEKPGYSLGRTSFLITSGGGIVEAQINGGQYKALAEHACAIMNGQSEPPEAVREAVHAAVAEALGEALDCTRTWSAWGAGTMGPDDFELVAEDGERVAEIADAAIAAYIKAVSHG